MDTSPSSLPIQMRIRSMSPHTTLGMPMAIQSIPGPAGLKCLEFGGAALALTLELVSELVPFWGLAGDGIAGGWTGITAGCTSEAGLTMDTDPPSSAATTITADIPVSPEVTEGNLDFDADLMRRVVRRDSDRDRLAASIM